jgi:hypothetical protein
MISLPQRRHTIYTCPDGGSGSGGGSSEWPDGAEGDDTEIRTNEHFGAYSSTVEANTTHHGVRVKPARRPRSTSIPSSSRSAQVNMKSVRFAMFSAWLASGDLSGTVAAIPCRISWQPLNLF